LDRAWRELLLMGLLWAAISGAFSGLMQGLLGLFGMSTAQKLGRAQVQNTDLKAENQLLKAQEQALEKKEDFRDALKHHDI
jgi:hypothetical protein